MPAVPVLRSTGKLLVLGAVANKVGCCGDADVGCSGAADVGCGDFRGSVVLLGLVLSGLVGLAMGERG